MANSAGRGALSASLPFASSDGSDVPRALEKCLRAYGTASALVRTRYAREPRPAGPLEQPARTDRSLDGHHEVSIEDSRRAVRERHRCRAPVDGKVDSEPCLRRSTGRHESAFNTASSETPNGSP